ncbi:hypothetical protein ABZ826_27555 [Streptomyces sp. NPDC047515]|uniref:hypothetical protein n=1 Tax=Streptomyces sp. NPDC047515 TaxID=3155380 RepID=UPI0033E21CE0
MARVRAAAAAVAAGGELLHAVAAVDESGFTVVGFTELVVPGDGQGDDQHYGTGVLAEHRGHGLARWTKAQSVLQAREHHPALHGPPAHTAGSDTRMRGASTTHSARRRRASRSRTSSVCRPCLTNAVVLRIMPGTGEPRGMIRRT